MYRIVRVSTSDYRSYRYVYSNIQYSYFKKGEEKGYLKDIVRQEIEKTLIGKGEFLDKIEDPCNELYFFEVDGNIQGFAELTFDEYFCNIYEFTVFEHNKGWGTIFFDEIYKIIKAHGTKKMILYCPFGGARIFWQKKGFSFVRDNFFQKNVR